VNVSSVSATVAPSRNCQCKDLMGKNVNTASNFFRYRLSDFMGVLPDRASGESNAGGVSMHKNSSNLTGGGLLQLLLSKYLGLTHPPVDTASLMKHRYR